MGTRLWINGTTDIGRRAFDLTHTSILEAPEVAHVLNEILASDAH